MVFTALFWHCFIIYFQQLSCRQELQCPLAEETEALRCPRPLRGWGWKPQVSLTSRAGALPVPCVGCTDGACPPVSVNCTHWGLQTCSWRALSGLGYLGCLPSLRILPSQHIPFILAFLQLLATLSSLLEDWVLGRLCHVEFSQLGQQIVAIVVKIWLFKKKIWLFYLTV